MRRGTVAGNMNYQVKCERGEDTDISVQIVSNIFANS
jgi:hypothetical protein